jgi:AraC family transcriptional regulator of adaptative response/methylated-DNA-[protein]-cysteine methyltransferase
MNPQDNSAVLEETHRQVPSQAAFDEAHCWNAILTRDSSANGRFVYAVRSTGIYCRPTCPSRRPRRDQVRFFPAPADAEAAGFRACQRCAPQHIEQSNDQLALVQTVCDLIEAAADQPPTLTTLGSAVGLSPSHLQRLFKRVMGISPRQYAESRRLARLKQQLLAGADVTDAIYEAGYNTSSRVYERAPEQLGMTPGNYGKGGAGMTIRYTLTDCTLGRLLVAATPRGLCAVSLGEQDEALVAGLQAEYPKAAFEPDTGELGGWVTEILQQLAGARPHHELPLDVQGTAFQWRVWEALRAIPRGEVRSYQDVARTVGQPNAARAVAQACASNRVAVVIPCHRVVREGGELGGYRWGIKRKQALLTSEGATP